MMLAAEHLAAQPGPASAPAECTVMCLADIAKNLCLLIATSLQHTAEIP